MVKLPTMTVIGGGIGGLTCALAWQAVGGRVSVFERSVGPSEVGAGITLWPNAMVVLGRLGLTEKLRAAGHELEEGVITDQRGRPLLRTPVGSVSRSLGSVSLGIHRATLLSILVEALAPGLIEYRKECVRTEDDGEGIVSRFRDGSAFRSDVLVAADGLRSEVFGQVHGTAPPRYAGYLCHRGIAQYAGEDVPAGTAFEAWGRGLRFGLVRLDQERVYWFSNESAPEPETRIEPDLSRLRRVFSSWRAPIPAVLAAADPASVLLHPIFDRPFRRDRQGRGRLTFVGDAAHPMTPDLGQGACQAIEDAAELSDCLARVADPEMALRAYESHRFPRVNRMVRRSRFQGFVSQHSTWIGCLLRNTIIRCTPERLLTASFRDLVAPAIRPTRDDSH